MNMSQDKYANNINHIYNTKMQHNDVDKGAYQLFKSNRISKWLTYVRRSFIYVVSSKKGSSIDQSSYILLLVQLYPQDPKQSQYLGNNKAVQGSLFQIATYDKPR